MGGKGEKDAFGGVVAVGRFYVRGTVEGMVSDGIAK
jgi:hypothetical protein